MTKTKLLIFKDFCTLQWTQSEVGPYYQNFVLWFVHVFSFQLHRAVLLLSRAKKPPFWQILLKFLRFSWKKISGRQVPLNIYPLWGWTAQRKLEQCKSLKFMLLLHLALFTSHIRIAMPIFKGLLTVYNVCLRY